MALRSYAGAAKRTSITGDITATSTNITVADGTGYPTGVDGSFAIALELGVAAEEKVLVASRSGNTLTVATGGRGWDGTTAAAHSAGSTVDHVLTATDVREANTHVNDTTGDPHPQYLTPTEANAAYRSINFRGASAYRATAQTIPNATWTAILWDAERYDTDAIHDLATNPSRFTIPTGMAGKWRFHAVIGVGASTGSRSVVLRLNGVDIGRSDIEGSTNHFSCVPVVKDWLCLAGNYVEVFINSTTSTTTRTGSECYFDAEYLGA